MDSFGSKLAVRGKPLVPCAHTRSFTSASPAVSAVTTHACHRGLLTRHDQLSQSCCNDMSTGVQGSNVPASQDQAQASAVPPGMFQPRMISSCHLTQHTT